MLVNRPMIQLPNMVPGGYSRENCSFLGGVKGYPLLLLVVLSRSTGGTAPRVLLSDSLQAPSLYKLRLFSVYSCQ
jgi:hypothetical protein